jgi:O-antigen ligase
MMVIFFMVAVEAFFFWFKGQRSTLPRWVHLFVVIGSPVIILLTLTRGNWLGFLAGLWVFALLGRTLLTRRQTIATVGLGCGLVPIVFLGALELAQTERLSTRINTLTTIEARLNTYFLVIKAGSQNPVFGIGLNNLRDYLKREGRFVEGETLGTSHSSYLSIFAELGVFGLIAYLAIMWSIYRTGLRIFRTEKGFKDQWRGVGVMAMLTAYLIPQLFSHMAYSPLLIHVYLFACVGAVAGRYEPRVLRTVRVRVPVKIEEPVSPELIPGRS